MFSALGLFKGIQCPRTSDCSLPSCFFSHEAQEPDLENDRHTRADGYDPLSVQDAEQPPPKKRRLDPESASRVRNGDQQGEMLSVITPKAGISTPSLEHKKTIVQVPSHVPSRKPTTDPEQLKVVRSLPQARPSSITRPVSPPEKKAPKVSTARTVEKLTPRQVAKAPVPFKSRLSYIELLHKLAKGHNAEVEKKDENDKNLVLDAQELIKLVLDDEEQAASASSADIYKNTMSQCYLRYKNISVDDWKSLVTDKFRSDHSKNSQTAPVSLSTALAPAEEIELLRGLKTAVVGLEAYGYVTTAPTSIQVQKAKDAVSAAHGFELCDRCGTRFQVFPGRDSQGRLTTQGVCHYHWARIPRTQTAKNARMFGPTDNFHPCCNQPPGSEGCTKAESHVFKVTDPKRLASLLQFEKTPEQGQKRRQPVTFDCEMAYTTYGMELVRVTAISWPESKVLLDVLVRPYGEILDFNTRFSGVSQDQFANAAAYDFKRTTDDAADVSADQSSLHKVESPAFARKLLFDLMTPDTPLIGHAIENDLNACRIVHPFIVDTVLLYPHPAGLPVRYGLKVLASKYLQRGIQQAGAEGHDSKEDSVATGDLVRLKVAEKWKSMKAQGWRFESAHLVAPSN